MALRDVVSAGMRAQRELPGGIVAEYVDDEGRIPEAGGALTSEAFCAIQQRLEDFFVRAQRGRVFGFAFTTKEKTFLYIYPALIAALRAKVTPFCLDPDQQTWQWIADAVKKLEIMCVLGDQTFLENASVKLGQEGVSVAQVEKVLTGAGDTLVCMTLKSQVVVEPLQIPHEDSFDLAYVVQTSGSTGNRKTVIVSQASIALNVQDFQRCFRLRVSQTILSASPPTFDPFYIDVFLAFLSGAKLVFASSALKAKSKTLAKVIAEKRINFIQMTSTLYLSMSGHLRDYLLSEENNLDFIILGGEQFPLISPELNRSSVRFFQAYGVTEMSCWQSLYEVDKDSLGYGEKPIYDERKTNLITKTQVYVDPRNSEIVVTSNERICLVDPVGINRVSDKLAVRTGDIGREGEGKIFFAGRIDDQLKIQGKRTSLTEIERAVSLAAKAPCTCVLASHNSTKNVIAFIRAVSTAQVEGALSNLPRHLQPYRSIHLVDAFPMTAHGKVNKVELLERYHSRKRRTVQISLRERWHAKTGKWPTKMSTFLSDGGDSFAAVQFLRELEEDELSEVAESSSHLLEALLNESFASFSEQVRRAKFFKNDNLILGSSNGVTGSAKAIKVGDGSEFVCKHSNVSYVLRGRRSNNDKAWLKFSGTDAKGLHPLWSVNLEKCIDASPLVVSRDDGDVVYVGSHSGAFICIDVDSGRERWKTRLPDRIEGSAVPSTDGEKIFVGCYDCRLYCMSRVDGDILWSYETGGLVKCTPAVVGDDYVIFGSYDHHLYCVSSDSSRLMWRTQVSDGSILATPVFSSLLSDIFCVTLDGVLARLSLADGLIVWRKRLGAPVFSSPLLSVTGSLLFCATVQGKLICLDPDTGDVHWNYSAGDAIFSPLVGEEDLVLFGCQDGRVYCVDNSGVAAWVSECQEGVVCAAPCVFATKDRGQEKAVLGVSSKGDARVINLRSGEEIFKLNLAGEDSAEVFSSPAVWAGRIVVGRRDDCICCYEFF